MEQELDISQLNPEDVRDKPKWFCSPWALAGLHLVLFYFGIMEIRLGWTAGNLGGSRVHWEMWVWGLWGLGTGAARLLVDDLRPIGRFGFLQCCVLRYPALRSGDWRHRAVRILLAAGILTAILLRGDLRSGLALSALAMGYVIGTLPSYPYWVRRWRLAWQIIRQVKAKEEGDEGSGQNDTGL